MSFLLAQERGLSQSNVSSRRWNSAIIWTMDIILDIFKTNFYD
jgi:hypothetical protein